MPKVLRVREDGKAQGISRERAHVPEDLGARIAVIQALVPLGLMAVAGALQREVEQLAAPRYAREAGRPGHVRWSKERGSVYLLDQKVPITYQRVRDQRRNADVSLATYQALQTPRQLDEGLLRRVLRGLSCRSYGDCAEAIPQAFGLSADSTDTPWSPSCWTGRPLRAARPAVLPVARWVRRRNASSSR